MDRGAWWATVQSQMPLSTEQQTRRLRKDCRKINPTDYDTVGEGLGDDVMNRKGRLGWEKALSAAEARGEGGLGIRLIIL